MNTKTKIENPELKVTSVKNVASINNVIASRKFSRELADGGAPTQSGSYWISSVRMEEQVVCGPDGLEAPEVVLDIVTKVRSEMCALRVILNNDPVGMRQLGAALVASADTMERAQALNEERAARSALDDLEREIEEEERKAKEAAERRRAAALERLAAAAKARKAEASSTAPAARTPKHDTLVEARAKLDKINSAPSAPRASKAKAAALKAVKSNAKGIAAASKSTKKGA